MHPLFSIAELLLIGKIQQTVKIDASTVEIEERGVKLRLTVVDTPGFGDSINSTEWWESVWLYKVLNLSYLRINIYITSIDIFA